MKEWRKPLLLAVVVIAVVVLSALGVRHVAGPRIVVRALAPNGVEFCIIQEWGDDFFNTRAFYRKPGGRWGGFYYDHDDWYWGKGNIQIDQQSRLMRVYRGEALTATFNYETETFSLLRSGFPQRVTTGSEDSLVRLTAGKNPWDGN